MERRRRHPKPASERQPRRREPARQTLPARHLRALVGLALLLRLAVLAWGFELHPELFHPDPAAIEARLADGSGPTVTAPGFEVSNVAWSLVCGQRGFAGPFGGDTGPTGWVSPGIVALWGGAFAAAGCFTPASLLLLVALAITFSLLMVLLAADAGSLLAGRRGALLAALLAACSPWDLAWLRGTDWMDLNTGPLALLTLAWLLLRLHRAPGRGRLAAFALTCAVATLLNPVLFFAAVAGFAVVLPVLPRRGRAVVGVATAQLLLVAPWLVYQHGAVGGWFFVKSNAAFEVALGNRPRVGGLLRDATFDDFHPSQNEAQYRLYRQRGELAYVEAEVRRFRRDFSLRRFAGATLRRLACFFFWHPDEPWHSTASRWLGRALAFLPGLVLVVYPLVRRLEGHRLDRDDALLYALVAGNAAPYLVAAVMLRYTLPMTPLVLLLAARAAAAFPDLRRPARH